MAENQEIPPTDTSTDPVTEYAQKVVSGEIVAGQFVRLACKRHLRDLEHGPERGLAWDLPAAMRAINFFSDVLCLAGGEFEGRPFVLKPWEQFIVGSLYGWKAPDGFRRFRVAYQEIGKGNGKSPLAAGIGLYMEVADNEPRAEIYAAATKKDQAMILFRDAVAMVEQSPALGSRITPSGGRGHVWNLAYLKTGSFFRPISSDDGQSGPRPHCGLIDELHEHKDPLVVDMMRAGTKGRRQAIIFIITNSGHDRQSVCWAYRESSIKALLAEKPEDAGFDDSRFAYICTLDPCKKHADEGKQQPDPDCNDCDDPLRDESCWIKANPNLGVSITQKYLRERVNEAKNSPAQTNGVLRLNFCVWTDAVSAWIGKDRWDSVQATLDFEKLRGRYCVGGLDLSSVRDLTAAAFVFPAGDGTMDAFVEMWTPKDTLRSHEESDRVPYALWARQGHIKTTPGAAVDYSFVAQRYVGLSQLYQIGRIAFDRSRIEYFKKELDAAGLSHLELIEWGQGFVSMGAAVNAIDTAIHNKLIRIHRNPCLSWNSASAVIDVDAAGNRKFTKRKSTGRIDGLVALAMAVGLIMRENDPNAAIADFLKKPVKMQWQ